MNNVPPDHDRPDDADELYRRAAALDPSRPSEAVRRAVLAHAARLGAERAAEPARRRTMTRTLLAYAWRRPAVFGTLAAAVIAGLVIVPMWPVFAPRSQPAPVTAELRDFDMAPPAENGVPAERVNAPPPPAMASPPERSFKGSAGRNANVAAGADTGREKSAPTEVDAMRAPTVAPPTLTAQQPAAPAPALPAARLTAQLQSRDVAAESTRGLVAARSQAAAGAPAGKAADQSEALRRAAAAGDLEALEAQVGRSDINAQDQEGHTALMLAVLGGQESAVNALLVHGADPNLADRRGITPLAAAIAANQTPMITVLRHYGAH